jgi:hypothetical protein
MMSYVRRRHTLKPAEIAGRLRIRTGRFYEWANEHRIPYGTVPFGKSRGAMRFSWPEVKEWLKTRPDLAAKLRAERKSRRHP